MPRNPDHDTFSREVANILLSESREQVPLARATLLLESSVPIEKLRNQEIMAKVFVPYHQAEKNIGWSLFGMLAMEITSQLR